MSYYWGPNVITDGLILYLDAANIKSYPGTGNVWYDLSGNEHHAYGDPNAAGAGYNDTYFPTWQSDDLGRFYFDGTDGLTILTDLGSHTELTIDTWLYKSTDTSLYMFDARNDGGVYWLSNYNSHNINIGSYLEADDPVTYQAASNWWSRWIHMVITSDATGSGLWINGEAIVDSRLKLSNSIDEDLGQYFRIGNRYTSANRWNGYFSNIKIYNKVLTDVEVKQNYNSIKSRFGL